MKIILMTIFSCFLFSGSVLATSDENEILNALILDARLFVGNASCELPKWRKVSDFLTEALASSMNQEGADSIDFRCPTIDISRKNCELLLNYKEGELTRTRMLRLSYLWKQKRIEPKSLICVDVP
ncbi:MAG: hypothetical protein AB7O96_05005 [Pseudobdellovibrionaceae bacterium]